MSKWQALTDEALMLLDDADRNRWRLGEIVCEVERGYGEQSIKSFCETVKANPKTMYQYAKVFRFYPRGAWQEYPIVRYTQWRDAMRLEDVEAAMQLIERANDDNMTMKDFYGELRTLLGKKSTRVEKLFSGIVTITYHDETITFNAPILLTDGGRYHITIREDA